MSPEKNSLEDIWVSWYNLKSLWKRHRQWLCRITLVCGCLTFLIVIFREPRYTAMATFKQSSSQTEQPSSLKDVLKTMGWKEEHVKTSSIMFSRRLMREVIEELGLQAEVSSQGFLAKIFERVKNNILSECRVPIEVQSDLQIRNVLYTKEQPLKLFLLFKDGETFEVLDKKKNKLLTGKIHENIVLEDVRFTVSRPSHLVHGRHYALKFFPWVQTVEKLKHRLTIKPLKSDPYLLVLQFLHVDRQVSAAFLNRLMQAYRNYIRLENEEISTSQLAYLESRQQDLSKRLDSVLEDQVTYLKKNAMEEGFLGLKEEAELLKIPKEKYLSQLLDMDFFLDRLKIPEKKLVLANPDHSSQEMTELTRSLSEVKHFIECLELKKDFPTSSSLLGNPGGLLKMLTEQIQTHRAALAIARLEEKQQLERSLREKEEKCLTHLTSLSDHWQMRKKRLEQNDSHKGTSLEEISDIDLASASQLLSHHQKEFAETHNRIREFLFVRDQLKFSSFEMSSLSSFFSDVIGQQIVKKGCELSQQIQDQSHHSPKEQERLKEALSIQKQLLTDHLEQMAELEKLRANLLQEKIHSIKKISIERIKKEKAFIQSKLSEIHQRMTNLIDKWQWEKKFKLQMALSKGIMEGMTHLLEAKNVNLHLFQVGAYPLDEAIIPFKANPPHLIIYSLLAGLLSFSVLYGWHFFAAVAKGLPVSPELIKISGWNFIGFFTKTCDLPLERLNNRDLETLRCLSNFLVSHKRRENCLCAVSLRGEQPSYLFHLAHLLYLQGEKVIIVECHFRDQLFKDEEKGLWQYLKQTTLEIPHICHLGSYDRIPTGGTAPFAVEELSGLKFSQLLKKLKETYSVILISSDSKPADAASHLFLKYADVTILSLKEENQEQIRPYDGWQKKNPSRMLSCVILS